MDAQKMLVGVIPQTQVHAIENSQINIALLNDTWSNTKMAQHVINSIGEYRL